MKITANRSASQVFVKCVYMTGSDTSNPELRTITVTRPDLKDALIELVNKMFLNVDTMDLDEMLDQDILDEITYNNENVGGYDYIFSLEVNNSVVINNTVGQWDY